jgi:hypothetical protein
VNSSCPKRHVADRSEWQLQVSTSFVFACISFPSTCQRAVWILLADVGVPWNLLQICLKLAGMIWVMKLIICVFATKKSVRGTRDRKLNGRTGSHRARVRIFESGISISQSLSDSRLREKEWISEISNRKSLIFWVNFSTIFLGCLFSWSKKL